MEEPTHFSLQLGTDSAVFQSDASPLRLDAAVRSPSEALEPLPGRYNMDRLQLMVQSPFRVFAYWEVTSDRLQEALALFPREEHPSFRKILRWTEFGQGPPQSFDSGAASEWWFATLPGNRYQAEICLHSEEFGTIPVFASNEVETPSDSVSRASLEIEGCPETTKIISKLVELTGLRRELSQVDSPKQIVRDNTQFGHGVNSERKMESTLGKLRKDTLRPTSSFW